MDPNFTSSERVLFTATVNFHKQYSPHLTEDQITEMAVTKILQKRSLAKKVSRSEYGH